MELGHRLLRQIETLNLYTVLFGPVHAGGKVDQLVVYLHTTHFGTATQGRIEHRNRFQFGRSIKD